MEAKFFLVLFLSSLKLSACSTTDFRGEYQEVPGGKVLFTDSSQVDSMNDGIYFEMHEATHANNGDPVIYPTEEWENWATFAYNTIVKHPMAHTLCTTTVYRLTQRGILSGSRAWLQAMMVSIG